MADRDDTAIPLARMFRDARCKRRSSQTLGGQMLDQHVSRTALRPSFSAGRGAFIGTDRAPAGYELVDPCGRGTFSEICKVRCLETGAFFALKRLRPEWLNEPDVRGLLQAEADAGRAARGEHVVHLVHAETAGAHPFVVLEWLDGQTLEQQLEQSDRLSVSTSVWIARQAAQGLQTLERAGFAHGDLKPENIYLCANGVVKLIDFGFAHRIDGNGPMSDCPDQKLLVGTAEYLAPESLTGGAVDSVCKDIYSLGITLFQMLAGRLPFTGGNAAEILRLQRQAKPPELAAHCPEAPQRLVKLVEQMLAKQPLRRPRNLSMLVRELIELEIATMPVEHAAC